MKRNRALMVAAALSGAMAVGAGAFGAHGAEGKAAEWLRTGGLYQLIHAGVAVAALAHARGRAAAVLMLAGAAIFSISLYAMALGAPTFLGMVTPIGGLVMILGWLALLRCAWGMKKAV